MVLALATLTLAQGWMHPGFYATYSQIVKNSGLLSLRGKEFNMTVTYMVTKVNGDMITLNITGKLVALVGAKKIVKPINITITVNPNWKNVSLPLLTPKKFDELKKVAKHQCNGALCTFYLNATQRIPNHNILLKLTGKEIIDAKLLILKNSTMRIEAYVTRGNVTRSIGSSITFTKLLKYGYK